MKNVGSIDKTIRLIVAVGLFSLLFILEGNIRFIGFVGVVPLVTALMSTCPLYLPFGISTRKKDSE